jgi:hypothetical protein
VECSEDLFPGCGIEPDPGVTDRHHHIQLTAVLRADDEVTSPALNRRHRIDGVPPMGGTTHTTARNRVNAVGERIDKQIQREIAENRRPDKPAEQMIIGIDGAFVKGRLPTDAASVKRLGIRRDRSYQVLDR